MGALGNVIQELMVMTDTPGSTVDDLEDIVLKIGVLAETSSVHAAARLVMAIIDGRRNEALVLAMAQLVSLSLAEDQYGKRI